MSDSDEREQLLKAVRRTRERLLWEASGGASGVPKRGRAPRQAPKTPLPAAATSPSAPAGASRVPVPAEARGAAATPASAPSLPASLTSGPRGAEGLRLVREELGDCQRCKLAPLRTNLVYGVGSPEAALVFVGEAPGENEDLQGEPFVGKAGELLTKMIAAMGFRRDEVYICNVIKCRPPGNRNPEPDEIAACEPFLIRQLGVIGPQVIVTLGKFAAQALLRSEAPISKLRGRFHRYQGVPLMPTFHPAYLLRNPSAKREVWDDLKQVMAELDRLGVPRGPSAS